MIESPSHFRFWIPDRGPGQAVDFGFAEQDLKKTLSNFLCMSFFSNRKSAIENLKLDHLITRSARNNTDCGIVRLSAFAVCKLITNSNFVGCSTGMSAGFVPLRILSTIHAARR